MAAYNVCFLKKIIYADHHKGASPLQGGWGEDPRMSKANKWTESTLHTGEE